MKSVKIGKREFRSVQSAVTAMLKCGSKPKTIVQTVGCSLPSVYLTRTALIKDGILTKPESKSDQIRKLLLITGTDALSQREIAKKVGASDAHVAIVKHQMLFS